MTTIGRRHTHAKPAPPPRIAPPPPAGTSLPIYHRTNELRELRDRLLRTDTVKRVVRTPEGISEVRETQEPTRDPKALAALADLVCASADAFDTMPTNERIQTFDMLNQALAAADRHGVPGILAPARELVATMLLSLGVVES